ncbi:MAG TPA: metal/formaldehyde-sensitive transcriptional repressor [Candidatus Saccharimonadales bacterium]|nr:metal/formaldehyde-sensitive transcriptional repressor [Candidatus Saccharimonadales bacterium]
MDLVNRTKKIIGQLESALRGFNEDAPCADVLQRLAASRGAINSLMAELMEEHIRNHMPRKTKSAEEAADDLIEIVHTYLKRLMRNVTAHVLKETVRRLTILLGWVAEALVQRPGHRPSQNLQN